FPSLAEEVATMQRFSTEHPGECLVEAIGTRERDSGVRVVQDNASFLAVAPFASRHPYEIMVVPQRHAGSLAQATDKELDSLAEILPGLLRAQFRALGPISYNFVVHVSPLPQKDHPDFHWHIEITPRLIHPDGFDLGSGISVNPVSPEAAADALRKTLI
ncbi:MAG: hypothetical protein WCA77_03410, partial [Thermoplasmata archaeon]